MLKKISKALNKTLTKRPQEHSDSKNQNSPNKKHHTNATQTPYNLYRSLSGQALDIAVKPSLVGELPSIEEDDNTFTFYVLKEYSRSNSILIDSLTKEHQLPPALSEVVNTTHDINEKAGIIFLHHSKADKSKNSKNTVAPRLQRLVTRVQQNSELNIRLIPVTIIWGRAPEKEDSLFKLLLADNWQEPTLTKQLFNIGVMGRDTFVEFHTPLDLSSLINDLTASTIKNAELSTSSTALITAKDANLSLTHIIQEQLLVKFDKHRASIIGPDLSDKRNVIDKLLYSPVIKQAIESESQASGKTVNEIRQTAKSYLNEIVTDYSYPIVRFFDHFLTWLWTQLYDGVEVKNFERVREVAPDYQVVYVPCHRSHIDYLLLSFIIYKQGLSIPYIAAGNNLNLPVLGQILRSGGAFFMRRSFKGNPLYSTVFKEYLHNIIERNNPLEYFVEGGRSRSGRLLPPKLGMISMTVQSHLRKARKPIVFIPAYIGYERIMEGGTYVGELQGKPKESESLIGLIKTSRKLEKVFGTVHLSFGKPLYLDHFMKKFDVEVNSLSQDNLNHDLDDNTQAMISNIGVKIMQNINKAAVINPVNLISLVLLSTPKMALDEDICREQIALYQRIAKSMPYDEDTNVTDMPPTKVIDYGIKLKLIERRPHLLGDMIQVSDGQAPLLSYFRNNILHVFILLSFIAALIERNGRMSRHRIQSIAEQLYPFLQTELFLKHPLRNIVTTINEKLDKLVEEGLIVNASTSHSEKQIIRTPEANSKCYQQLSVLATPIGQSLERYIMTLALLAQQGSGQLTAEQVIDLCHLLGQRLSVLYADDIPDAFDPALFKGFIDTLVRLDYVQKHKETGILSFDHRINDIAEHAEYILTPDMMNTLKHIANLGKNEIDHVLKELSEKKQRKFRRKRS